MKAAAIKAAVIPADIRKPVEVTLLEGGAPDLSFLLRRHLGDAIELKVLDADLTMYLTHERGEKFILLAHGEDGMVPNIRATAIGWATVYRERALAGEPIDLEVRGPVVIVGTPDDLEAARQGFGNTPDRRKALLGKGLTDDELDWVLEACRVQEEQEGSFYGTNSIPPRDGGGNHD
jgi:hypothetical protein